MYQKSPNDTDEGDTDQPHEGEVTVCFNDSITPETPAHEDSGVTLDTTSSSRGTMSRGTAAALQSSELSPVHRTVHTHRYNLITHMPLVQL